MSVKRINDETIDCNGVILDKSTAREVFYFIEREFYMNDVVDKIHDDYPDFDPEKNKDLIDDITDLYDKYRSNDDSWALCLSMAISEHEDEIEASISKSKNKDTKNNDIISK